MPDPHYIDHLHEARRMAEIRERREARRDALAREREIVPGCQVLRIDRSGRWDVLEVQGRRARLRPEGVEFRRSVWAAVEDLVRCELESSSTCP